MSDNDFYDDADGDWRDEEEDSDSPGDWRFEDQDGGWGSADDDDVVSLSDDEGVEESKVSDNESDDGMGDSNEGVQTISYSDTLRTGGSNLMTTIANAEKGKQLSLAALNAQFRFNGMSNHDRFMHYITWFSKEYEGDIDVRMANAVQTLTERGAISHPERKSALALMFSLQAMDTTTGTIDQRKLDEVIAVIRTRSHITPPAVIRYCRWWTEFLKKQPIHFEQR